MRSRYRDPTSKPKADAAKKLRTCLKCQESFSSESPGHRICRTCTRGRFRKAAMQSGLSENYNIVGEGSQTHESQ